MRAPPGLFATGLMTIGSWATRVETAWATRERVHRASYIQLSSTSITRTSRVRPQHTRIAGVLPRLRIQRARVGAVILVLSSGGTPFLRGFVLGCNSK